MQRQTCCDTRVAQTERIGLRHFHLPRSPFAGLRLGLGLLRLRDEPIALEQFLNLLDRVIHDDVDDGETKLEGYSSQCYIQWRVVIRVIDKKWV